VRRRLMGRPGGRCCCCLLRPAPIRCRSATNAPGPPNSNKGGPARGGKFKICQPPAIQTSGGQASAGSNFRPGGPEREDCSAGARWLAEAGRPDEARSDSPCLKPKQNETPSSAGRQQWSIVRGQRARKLNHSSLFLFLLPTSASLGRVFGCFIRAIGSPPPPLTGPIWGRIRHYRRCNVFRPRSPAAPICGQIH